MPHHDPILRPHSSSFQLLKNCSCRAKYFISESPKHLVVMIFQLIDSGRFPSPSLTFKILKVLKITDHLFCRTFLMIVSWYSKKMGLPEVSSWLNSGYMYLARIAQSMLYSMKLLCSEKSFSLWQLIVIVRVYIREGSEIIWKSYSSSNYQCIHPI